MTTIKEGLAIAAALMLISTSAFAQSTPRDGTTTTASSATAGSFESLSPGNQKIVRALFLAQRPSRTGPAPLSLNQIAALKGSEGWGQVFKQMKTEGLVQDKNLGQAVSSYEHHVHSETAMHHGHTVTTGRDHDVVSGSGHGRGDADRDHDVVSGSGHHRGDADRDGRIADEDRNIKGTSARGAHDADSVGVTTASGASAGGHSAVGGSVHPTHNADAGTVTTASGATAVTPASGATAGGHAVGGSSVSTAGGDGSHDSGVAHR